MKFIFIILVLRAIFYIVLFNAISYTVFGQSDDTKHLFYYETAYYQGKLFKIYDVFPESKSASAVDFRIGLITNGSKYWHKEYNYPAIKLTFSFSDYGNKDVLGSSLSIFPSIGSKLKLGETFRFNYDAGFGFAYFNKPFDEFTNPTNNVIGSKIVATVSLRGVLEKDISENLSIHLGGSFRHYSNAHIKVPNVGGNLIYVTGGIKYNPNSNPKIWESQHKPVNKKLRYQFNFGLGFHEIEGTTKPYGGPLYPVYNGTFSVVKRFSYKHRYSIGFNYNYYTDYYDFIKSQQVFYDKQRLKSSKMILFLGHEWIYNHISIETKLGANLYYPFRYKLIEMQMLDNRFMDNFLSAQFGFNYYLFGSFSPKHYNPSIGVFIRTIGGKADFSQIRLGILF